jgi:hypothetical protein
MWNLCSPGDYYAGHAKRSRSDKVLLHGEAIPVTTIDMHDWIDALLDQQCGRGNAGYMRLLAVSELYGVDRLTHDLALPDQRCTILRIGQVQLGR